MRVRERERERKKKREKRKIEKQITLSLKDQLADVSDGRELQI